MSWIGIVLIVAAFVVLTPKGALPGSTASRNIRIGAMPIVTTPGYQKSEARAGGGRRAYRIGLGLALLAAGIVLLVIGS